jgi:hypothetical protein
LTCGALISITKRMFAEYHWSQVDHLRRLTVEQGETITRLRHELAVERAKRLRAEQLLAIARGDEQTWARVTEELLRCGVLLEELE